MVQVVWAFLAKEEARQQFILVFGPGGVWSNFFASAAGFRGAVLLCQEDNPSRFLLIETWQSVAKRQGFLDEHAGPWSELLDRIAQLIETKAELGTFRMLAESTVRTRSRR